eukprot:Phypoly_transcript_04588.p1 GENE.Phypoly_transcript_04588~~Phypoly_transcript_04588.p1  ORF type:complete len:601 (+),score=91.42 Phypoly_transcript_04588:309-2111(+)
MAQAQIDLHEQKSTDGSMLPPEDTPVHPQTKKRKLSLSQQIFDKLSHPLILCNTAAKGDLIKLKLLVEEEKFNVNDPDYDGRTPLHLAAEEGHLETVKYLVQRGANINVEDRWGTVPLRGAISFNRNEVAAYLREIGATMPYYSKKARELRIATRKDEMMEFARGLFRNIGQSTFASPASPTVASLEGQPLLNIPPTHPPPIMFDDVSDDSAIHLKSLVLTMRDKGLNYKKIHLLNEELNTLDQASGGVGTVSFASFANLIIDSPDSLLSRTLRDELVIPNWAAFCTEVEKIFEDCRGIMDGENANYIPELANVDPKSFALAIVTVDGQILELGDCHVDFSIQSTGKPLQYSICAENIGMDEIHQYVGQEPSGVAFNAFSLNEEKKPHNPLINAGAIMTSSLICPELDMPQRFKFIIQRLSELAGDAKVTFSQPIYLSEKSVAHRNFALAHFMKSEGGFPPKVDILEAVDFYFQVCSCEVNCTTMAGIASTYANLGRSPLSNKKVLSGEVVKNTIQLMYTCGMYDYSGEWACKVGVPAKSGVSGVLMVVIPDKLGLAIFSPKLDKHGNSVRGVEFCKRFVKKFNWSMFDVMFSKYDNRLI